MTVTVMAHFRVAEIWGASGAGGVIGSSHFARRAELTYLALPSTSPAHARMDFAAKLAQWTALREALAGH